MDGLQNPLGRVVDIPKPETGLAEWTSKIKAMQRQVDADEETEQKRLEEEIAVARQARLRRSRGAGGGSRVDSFDFSRSREQLNFPSSPNDVSNTDVFKLSSERQSNQSDALRKLMGQNSVHIPDKKPGTKSEAVSLASFIGGNATGPRLNRHAAQQDTRDPTQFDQPEHRGPHPIFGKGRIAMPGMISEKDIGSSGTTATWPPVDEHRKSFSGYKPSSMVLQPKPSDQTAKPVYLRKPEIERRKSTSPIPMAIAGSEGAERYRPSVSPAPKYSVKPQKSVEMLSDRSESTERYRSTPSPTPKSSTLSQKAQGKFDDRSLGTEGAERYRSTSNTTPKLGSASYKVPENIKDRPVSPQKMGGGDRTSIAPRKPATELKSQKSWTSEDRPVSLQKTGGRVRTFSSPKADSSDIKPSSPYTPNTWTSASASYRPPGQSPTKDSRFVATSYRERTISTPSYLPRVASTPHQTNHPSGSPSPSQANIITTPSLARPIQPEHRLVSMVSTIPATSVPSPAFQKSSFQKDLSPSISRLQGRGFVQNMVKASLQLGSDSYPSSATSSPADQSRPVSGRKSSVLDRWQPQNQTTSSPPVSPTKPSYATPMRRATTMDPSISIPKSDQTRASSSSTPRQSLRTVPKPSVEDNSNQTPTHTTTKVVEKPPLTGNFGSATTLFVVKPSSVPSPFSAVDELGVKRDTPTRQNLGRDNARSHHHIPSEIPAPSGKPLIHPTKDRARKPKKGASRIDVENQLSSAASSEIVDTPESREIHPWEQTPASSSVSTAEEKPQPTTLDVSKSTLPSDSKVNRLTAQWAAAGPIVAKSIAVPNQSVVPKETKKYPGLRHALPGMTKESSQAGEAAEHVQKPVPRPITPKQQHSESLPFANTAIRPPFVKEERSPTQASPSKHTRIPSTGNRATVMEVAQALNEHVTSESSSSVNNELRKLEEPVAPNIRDPPSSPGIEKRKSSYEKYSAIILPPLKEEATPIPSPASTLTRTAGHQVPTSKLSSPFQNVLVPENLLSELKKSPISDVVNFIHDDQALPDVDTSIMVKPSTANEHTSKDVKTISVDVLIVTGTSNIALSQNVDIFYDTEVLAIIHRTKSKTSGLATTTVWGWVGKRSQYGESEGKKLYELAKRYGTTPIVVRQYSEPVDLIRLLGGKAAVRQGSRTHWSSDNTAMHIVRSIRGVILIDELDLSIKNLCSAFSYCVTILETVYVWQGSGSTSAERQAAVAYAQRLTKEGASIAELFEGESDNDEMFWMILGDDPYANADYWKWRQSSAVVDPSIWRVDSNRRMNALVPVDFIVNEEHASCSVYVINCIWELFVLVGADARGARQDIRLALDIATKCAKRASSDRPYTPTVHVIVLPSQLPLDLRLHIRDIDETALNGGDLPDHMNLLSATTALNHLQSRSWDKDALRDPEMLPLGLDASSSITS